MDWKTLRQDKLAKTRSYKPAEPREEAWWGIVDRLGSAWERFMTLAWWEKGMVIGTGVLLAILTPMAAFALMGGDDGTAAPVATDTPVVIVADGPTPTNTVRPTSTPKAIPATVTPRPENRKDCDEIRGTEYLSDEERDWYVGNCDEDTPEPTATDTPAPSGPVNPPPPPPTDPPPPTEPTISAAQARSIAAGWIRSNPAFAEVTVSAASCTAQASGTGWTVSCTGTTTGCQGSACSITIRVCVEGDGSARQC